MNSFILVVAILSAPTPFRVFMNEPSNLWITRAPWVWLPSVMVLAAILGHALVYRWLLGAQKVSGRSRSASAMRRVGLPVEMRVP